MNFIRRLIINYLARRGFVAVDVVHLEDVERQLHGLRKCLPDSSYWGREKVVRFSESI